MQNENQVKAKPGGTRAKRSGKLSRESSLCFVNDLENGGSRVERIWAPIRVSKLTLCGAC